MTLRRYARIAFLLGLGCAMVVLATVPIPIRDWLTQLEDGGDFAVVLLAAAYIPAAVLLLPALLFTLSAGYCFGLWRGVLAAIVGATLGASVVFFLGRTLAREWVEARLAKRPRFRALDRAVGEHGFKIVLLMRLSPAMPYNVMNYAFSITRVSFRDFFFGTAIGMLPVAFLYAYLGAAAHDAARNMTDVMDGRTSAGDPTHRLVLIGGVISALGATVVLTRIARRALSRVLDEADAADAEKLDA
jgi:uncharacterized membrane protein YdjX (TVP38/TMEM64 family)